MCSPQIMPATPAIAPSMCDDMPPPLSLGARLMDEEAPKTIGTPVMTPSMPPTVAPASILKFLRQGASVRMQQHMDVVSSSPVSQDYARIPSVTVVSKSHPQRVARSFTVDSSLRDSLSPGLSGATAYSSSRVGDDSRSMCSAHSDEDQVGTPPAPALIPVM